ncbi:hypothetical protein KCU76_g54, partial [Aureobasidium melanogenum]
MWVLHHVLLRMVLSTKALHALHTLAHEEEQKDFEAARNVIDLVTRAESQNFVSKVRRRRSTKFHKAIKYNIATKKGHKATIFPSFSLSEDLFKPVRNVSQVSAACIRPSAWWWHRDAWSAEVEDWRCKSVKVSLNIRGETVNGSLVFSFIVFRKDPIYNGLIDGSSGNVWSLQTTLSQGEHSSKAATNKLTTYG